MNIAGEPSLRLYASPIKKMGYVFLIYVLQRNLMMHIVSVLVCNFISI